MAFRKESRHDSFQRQISALRQQLSADQDADVVGDEQSSPPVRLSPKPEAPAWSDHQPSSPAPSAPPSSEAGVIDAGSSWTGSLRTGGSVHIYGAVEGEIHAADDVFVAEGAVVDAHVTATNVIVAGTLGGTIQCRGRLEVWPTGHIAGDVSAPSLVIHEGASVDGKVAMRPSDDTA